MTADYRLHFDELAKAIQSLEVFPQVIRHFTGFLRERYKKKHLPSDLVWVSKLCSEYEVNCRLYVKFIKRVVVTQFLAKCMNANEVEGQTEALIKALRDDIGNANNKLDNFLGKAEETKEFANKLDGELSKMEAIQQKEDKTKGVVMKFGGWLKEETGKQFGDALTKIVGTLFDSFVTNAYKAVDSGYSFKDLKKAVESIQGSQKQLEESRERNRKALADIVYVLDTFENMLKHKEYDLLRKAMRSLHDKQGVVGNACDFVVGEVKKLSDE